MKANYLTRNGRLTFEVQAETAKALFSEIASVQEVFEAEAKCGVCGSEEIVFQVRTVEDYVFHELRCNSKGCGARFSFGQAKKGGALFPKRKDEDGHWLPTGGWEKYIKPGTIQPPSERPVDKSPAPAAGSTPPAEPPQDRSQGVAGGGNAVAPMPSEQPSIAQSRPVPEELQLAFKRISDKEPGAVSEAFKFIESELVEEYTKAGDNAKGSQVYGRIVIDWRKLQPGDKAKDIGAIKACMLDLWDALTVIRDTNSMKDSGVPTVEEMKQGVLA